MNPNEDWVKETLKFATEKPLVRVDCGSPTGLIKVSLNEFDGSTLFQQGHIAVYYMIYQVGDGAERQELYYGVLKKLEQLNFSEQFDELVWWLVTNYVSNIRDIADALDKDNDVIQLAYERARPKRAKIASTRHSEKNRWKSSLFEDLKVPSDGFVLNKPITGRIIAKKLDDDTPASTPPILILATHCKKF